MKFLIDENLPPALVEVFRRSGLECRHINFFANEHPISDNAIRRFSLHHDWVIVTKDDDFVKSFVSRKVPEKLIYVFGLTSRAEILQRFEEELFQIVNLLAEKDLLEMNRNELKIHF